MAPRGISLHVGVNRPDRKRFEVIQELRACENDAHAMQRLAAGQGFETTLLLGEAATADAVADAVRSAAGRVGGEDIFLLTYSGHGSQVRDQDGDEGDGMDETWCLYDGELVDDDLCRLSALFPPGARVLVVSDSCHSGTVIRKGETAARPARAQARVVYRGGFRDGAPAAAAVPRQPVVRGVAAASARGQVAASVLLLAAALDGQTARDGVRNGAFTDALLRVWRGGAFQGSYGDFHAAIYRLLRGRQSPCLERAGVRSPAFEAQRPFTI